MKHLVFLFVIFGLACSVVVADSPETITSGTVSVTWNAEKRCANIADEKGVYATIPLNDVETVGVQDNGKTLFCRSGQTGVYFLLEQGGDLPPFVGIVCTISRIADQPAGFRRFPAIELLPEMKVDSLKSFGSTGLKPIDARKGSHLFLAIADPVKNSGVVSGWATVGIGAGVVFSEKTDQGRTRIIPEVHYGKEGDGLRGNVPIDGESYLSEMFVVGRFDDAGIGLESYADLLADINDVPLKSVPIDDVTKMTTVSLDELWQDEVNGTVKTSVELYRESLKKIQAAAPENFILGCTASESKQTLGASVGLLDGIRLDSADVSDWSRLKKEIAFYRNLYFLNGRVWHHAFLPVAEFKSMSMEQTRLVTTWTAVSGQRLISEHGLVTARPLDLFREDLPRIWHLTNGAQGAEQRDIVVLYNWDEKNPATISWNPDTVVPLYGSGAIKISGILPFFVAYDFWNDKPHKLERSNFQQEDKLAPGSCLVLAIRRFYGWNNYPTVLSSSRHVTQGMLDLSNEKWDETAKTLSGKILSGTGNVVGDDELRVFLPYARADLKPSRVFVSKGSATMTLDETHGDALNGGKLLRVTIKSEQTGNVDWSIRF